MIERTWVIDVDDIAYWLDQMDNPQRYGAQSMGNFPVTCDVSYQGSPCTNVFGYLQPDYGGSYWPPGAYAPGWATALHNDAVKVTVPETWSDYNSGVTSPSTGYHAKWILDKDIPGGLMLEMNNPSGGNGGVVDRWLGTDVAIDSILAQQKECVVSFEGRSPEAIKVRLSVYGKYASADTQEQLWYEDVELNKDWNVYSGKWHCTGISGAGYFYFYGGGSGLGFGQVQVRNPMLTTTGRKCRYTPGTRGATVNTGGGWQDVTFQGNNVDLTDAAFDWNDWILSIGKYFTDTSSIANLGSAVIKPTFEKHRFITIELWVRKNSIASDAITDCAIYGAQNSSGLVLNRYGQFNFVCAASSSNLDRYEYPGINSSRLIQYINTDQWYHVVQILGNKHVCYVNGVKVHETTDLAWNPVIGTSFKFLHGNADWLTQTTNANNSKSRVMQDGCWSVQCVRVYKRELTADEVAKCYNEEREMYAGALGDISFDKNIVGDISYA